MPFKFTYFCDLLSDLEKIQLRDPPLLRDARRLKIQSTVENWFKTHRRTIEDRSTNQVALLSTLFPERRTDRVYHIQEASLEKIAGRCLCLNSSKRKDLQNYKTSGRGDLGVCLENVLKQSDSEPKPGIALTVEDVDSALQNVASQCRFSSKEVRSRRGGETSKDCALESIFLRLTSRDAKWFVRLMLKDFAPVVLDPNLVLSRFHFLLPDLLRFQNSFDEAISLLQGEFNAYHADPNARSRAIFRREASKKLTPKIGVKIGRPPFEKARSISHCLKMVGKGRWNAEQKYDGEYCEIHIDLEQSPNWIKIYSKSGKESTKDRAAIHQTIRKSLCIETPLCKFKRRCILLGELLVYSDEERRILDFHKIRKHVSRSGSFLGTEQDSMPHDYEHLMIMFFDVLMIDDDMVLRKPHAERRAHLKHLMVPEEGRAQRARWIPLDFSVDGAEEELCQHYAQSRSERHEGLILKAADAPYFSLGTFGQDQYHGYIKVKADYMAELGEERDVADFAVVGASYNARQAQRCRLKNLRWTTFHLGCLENPEAVRFGAIPVFKVVGSIDQDQCIPNPELEAVNELGPFRSQPFLRAGGRLANPERIDLHLDASPCSKMDVVFNEPFVAEVLGSGFDKPPNKDFFMLRHPRVLKVHLDRTWKETISVDGLRSMADEARRTPKEPASDEHNKLLASIQRKFRQRDERESMSRMTTPRSALPSTPPSSRRTSPRSSRPTPSLIRIDTSELLPGDRIQRSGDGRSTPRPSSARGSIDTPPSSRESRVRHRASITNGGPVKAIHQHEIVDLTNDMPPPPRTHPSSSRSSKHKRPGPAVLPTPPSSGESQVVKKPEHAIITTAISPETITPETSPGASRKRRMTNSSLPEISQPPIKRHRTNSTKSSSQSKAVMAINLKPSSASQPRRNTPLADITNISPSRIGTLATTTTTISTTINMSSSAKDKLYHTRSDTPSPEPFPRDHGHSRHQRANATPARPTPSPLSSTLKSSPPLPPPPGLPTNLAAYIETGFPSPPYPFFSGHCGYSNDPRAHPCPFATSTVYLSRSITGLRMLQHDLLPSHGGTRCRDLQHWDREVLFNTDPHGDVVGESPAERGKVKIVLVNSLQKEETERDIKEVLRWKFRDRVWVFHHEILIHWAAVEIAEAEAEAEAERLKGSFEFRSSGTTDTTRAAEEEREAIFASRTREAFWHCLVGRSDWVNEAGEVVWVGREELRGRDEWRPVLHLELLGEKGRGWREKEGSEGSEENVETVETVEILKFRKKISIELFTYYN
ncbi:hypothetical protein K402DRAFT_454217 [Aulographum hederae CBS 113979]|uniref:ATP-dependent DNA ligase family profile domain-containing protein n=1 Tax=Aulographum hederae CBS 113979 TaxID=1176131 RepID=A0A6G1H0P3_9PEZI|nr:hypothetical protein K402DRAFT_454217 [Aulographum hederae CBS 113979]